MSYYEIELQKTMTPEQRMYFQQEYSVARKDPTIAILLGVFLGGFGAHRFYLGENGAGVVYLIFFWAFIPWIIAWIECIGMSEKVERYNQAKANEIAARVRVLCGGQALAPATASAFCTKCGAQMAAEARFCQHCGAETAAPVR